LFLEQRHTDVFEHRFQVLRHILDLLEPLPPAQIGSPSPGSAPTLDRDFDDEVIEVRR
jgi:hypothetical protein